MAISFLTASAIGAQTTAVSVTLPGGIPGGSIAYLVVHAATSNTTTYTGFSGWSVVDGPEQGGVSVAEGWILKKSVTAADSGATVTATLSSAVRWGISCIVVTGAKQDQIKWGIGGSSTTATINVPAYTPVVDDCLAIMLVGEATGSGQGSVSTTPPAGWTKQIDTTSNYGSANEVSTMIATKQLVGQGGIAQAATTMTASKTVRANVWILTVAAATPPTAAFTSNSTNGTATFDASSSTAASPATVASYSWDFGDGGTSTSAAPTHTYVATGTYTVSLTVTDSNGIPGTITHPVVITYSSGISYVTSTAVGAQNTSLAIVLPANIPAGSTAYLVIDATRSTAATLSGFGDWTILDGPEQGGANITEGWLLTKRVGVADSNTTASGTLSGSARWGLSCIVLTGSTLDQWTYGIGGTTDTVVTNLPAYTPGANDCLVVLLAGISTVSDQGSDATTPPAQFTTLVDTSSNYGSGNDVETLIAVKQFIGQAGVAQSATTMTSTKTHRANIWMLTAKPATAPVSDAGPDQTALEPWSTVLLDASASAPIGGTTIASYAWTQSSGTPVTLSSTAVMKPTFRAPASAVDQTLVFSLTVTDNLGRTSSTDTVSITILPATEFYLDNTGTWKPLQVSPQ